MATLTLPKKSVVVNPLKQSQPLGAALAFLGVKGTIPLLHGSQGCTAFAKVLLVRHFRESIPLSTTAMTEVTTILGGEENIEVAIQTLLEKAKPEIIALCTTALTETRGDDLEGILKTIRQRHPEWYDLPIVWVSTPDYRGALQEGFASAVEALAAQIPQPGERRLNQVNVLASAALTPGDVREIEEMMTSFGLAPIIVPHLGASLDGHLEEDFQSVTPAGTTLPQLRQMGSSIFTFVLGESLEKAAQILSDKFGIDYEVFSHLSTLEANDNFLQALSLLSGREVPVKYRHQRRQLLDAMLDTHFYFGHKKVCLALEPDLLTALTHFLLSMGAEIQAAVTTTKAPSLADLPIASVTVGDLEDFERLAPGADLLITNSHGKRIAKKLGVPLFRQGFPIVDRLGNGFGAKVGYRGTIQLLFEIGNLFLEREEG
ncbi:MAG: nitrogenase iron-molybdenum cofactor biosynthesis protein NifN [Cyanobacteria bacterium RI_101]|nr:nitrogenase iron-molybdenum cofactor biosynthesis protein NifN [Cyanobacteria bacterium RI_101]